MSPRDPAVARSITPVEDHRVEPLKVSGKFLQAGDERFLVRGVTYGTFAPDAAGYQLPPLSIVREDFARMRRFGVNSVRTYTPPDIAFLDEAARHGLRVMIGIPWTQHVAFLDDREMTGGIRRDVVAHARKIASHPAVLLIALGNEIPAPVVRWHGKRRIGLFLKNLYDDVKSAAPQALLTYVNFPPTEYLDLSFLDVCTFNVYLHSEQNLRRYLARLQHVAGPKPLLLTEAGADSIREGTAGQADLVAMQLRAAFAEGAAGAFAFAWTDEWWRGGHQIEDWSFGLVDRARRPKPALEAVTRVFQNAPFPNHERREWPKISVVVCAYNAADTIDECITSLERLTYPNFEVIVVNDGSRDATGTIAKRHSIARVIETPNAGLSTARNIGLEAATGDIVAYTDADVRVDPDWLTYLVQPFLTSDVVGAGGPNVVPPDDPWVAQCVARAPGGPTHVLFDDRIAEHVPGCNMAFRREALQAIGGFNPIYVRAGDDVDVCWRLQQKGWRLGFAASALVWHRHRRSVRSYWRQQVGYGEGQQWLRPHHPDKFNGFNVAWRGHIYSSLPRVRFISQTRVNSGPWGTAAFPSVYHVGHYPFAYMPHSVRWQGAMLACLAGGFLVGAMGGPLLAAILLGLTGVSGLALTVSRCVRFALASDVKAWPTLDKPRTASRQLRCRALIAWLHFVQPLARAHGRVRAMFSVPQKGLREAGPKESRSFSGIEISAVLRLLLLRRAHVRYWSETWTSVETVLTQILTKLRSARVARVLEVDDGWQAGRDISVSVGPWVWLDIRAVVEEHGGGRCLVRVTKKLRATAAAIALGAGLGVWIAVGAWTDLRIAFPLMTSTGALVLALLGGAMARRVANAAAVTMRTVAQVAVEGGMVQIEAPAPATAAAPAAASTVPSIATAVRPFRAAVMRMALTKSRKPVKAVDSRASGAGS